LGGYEYSLALGEQVADQVCDRMAFACAWRPFYENAGTEPQLIEDSFLLVVDRKWKVSIA
jgi:hypothetical protein